MAWLPCGRLMAGLMTALLSMSAQAAGPDGPKPPAQVVVESVKAQDFAYRLEFPARVAGSRQVEVRAQVSGILQARTYEEGQAVTKGQVLFKIDPRTYEANLARAKATLAQEQARHRQAERNLERIKKIQAKGYASSSELDNAISAYEQTKANIEAARAEVLARQIDLDYTTVRAPISGITSQEARSEGSLVVAADPSASLLTQITQLDPVYVNFAYPDQVLEKLRVDAQQGWLVMANKGALKVAIANHPHLGQINFTDSLISRGTGTVTARAVVPNPEQTLLPGQFVRVKIQGLTYPQALSVPERAVSQSQQGTLVYVVNEQGIAQERLVKTGITTEGRWLIHEGLKVGERVIVEGLSHVMANEQVVVVEHDKGAMASAGGDQ